MQFDIVLQNVDDRKSPIGSWINTHIGPDRRVYHRKMCHQMHRPQILYALICQLIRPCHHIIGYVIGIMCKSWFHFPLHLHALTHFLRTQKASRNKQISVWKWSASRTCIVTNTTFYLVAISRNLKPTKIGLCQAVNIYELNRHANKIMLIRVISGTFSVFASMNRLSKRYADSPVCFHSLSHMHTNQYHHCSSGGFLFGCRTSSLSHLNMEISNNSSVIRSNLTRFLQIFSARSLLFFLPMFYSFHSYFFFFSSTVVWERKKRDETQHFSQFFRFKWNRTFASKIASYIYESYIDRHCKITTK